jgi:2-polyprenyl-3-methyl-5-hydroxy-6-metoxy-1,4-benzoquinol methylase
MGSAQIQGDLWGARAGEWADLQEGSFRPLYEAGFSAAHVGTGTSLLDVGCGAGLAPEMAEARGAKISGLDAAAGLVELAKSRCPCADIRVGEIEELPFLDLLRTKAPPDVSGAIRRAVA